jgi:arylsulfatase A
VAGLPEKFGFDEHCLWQHMRRPSRYKNPGLEIDGKEVDYTKGEYGPDIVNDWAIDFIERHKDRPFFLYYPQMLTHSPFEPTPDNRDYHGKPARPNADVEPDARPKAHIAQANFGAMVTYMDKLIGKLVTRLEELQLHENTLILFLGDNGTGAGIRSKMGDRVIAGGKGKLTDAGMHVPLIAYWHGTIAGRKVSHDLVDTTDFLPTICQAAGCELPKDPAVDGRSFLPQLRGEKGNPREWYYCWYAPRREFVGEFAANHRYKLYRDGRVFDLKADPDEENPLDRSNLQGEAAAEAKTLQAALDKYKNARPEHLE